LPEYLKTLGVAFHFGAAVTAVESGRLVVGGEEIHAGKILLCTGDDFETLFLDRFRESGLTRSKLQMLRLKPRDSSFRLGTHLCAGLTLGHYANFRVCDSLAPLLERYGREMPDYIDWGIHLLVSQHQDGCITVGDSHEYGLAVTPFMREDIEKLILAYLDTFLPLDQFDVIERWFGVYAKHPEKSYVVDEPMPGVHIVTGVGGAGMTLSFGLADAQVKRILASG
jgi:FAD dependent oxidoreductase TIGR03364